MSLDFIGVEHFGEIFDLDQRLCLLQSWRLPRLFLRFFAAQSCSLIRSVLSQRDMSERMTVSPSCSPSMNLNRIYRSPPDLHRNAHRIRVRWHPV